MKSGAGKSPATSLSSSQSNKPPSSYGQTKVTSAASSKTSGSNQ